MDVVLRDFRYAFRALSKNPGFTTVVVLTLALGLGATTAIFTVVNGVLLEPLGYAEADRLVAVWEDRNEKDADVSYFDYRYFREQTHQFESLAAISHGPGWPLNLTGFEAPEQVRANYVSANLFEILGVKPLIGRTFLPEEDAAGSPHVAILSHGFWRSHFGDDPGIVGAELVLSDIPHAVIGVMPANFEFKVKVDLWIPIVSNPFFREREHVHSLMLLGKLRVGTSLADARAEMELLSHRLEIEFPESHLGHKAKLVSLRDQVVGPVRPALLILLGAVGLVLLIACANVTNLFLTRALARRKEVAIRVSLGATRIRLFRQFLTEGFLLVGLGAALGLIITAWGVDLLLALSPAELPRTAEVRVDWTVFGFAGVISVCAGVLLAATATLKLSGIDTKSSLWKGERASAGTERGRLRRLLVVSQMALALMLLIGAGLLARSFLSVMRVDPGFTTEDVLTFSLRLPDTHYGDWRKRQGFARDLIERLGSLPGIVHVGATNRIPMSRGNGTSSVVAEEHPLSQIVVVER